jgi:hypothetical protein
MSLEDGGAWYAISQRLVVMRPYAWDVVICSVSRGGDAGGCLCGSLHCSVQALR